MIGNGVVQKKRAKSSRVLDRSTLRKQKALLPLDRPQTTMPFVVTNACAFSEIDIIKHWSFCKQNLNSTKW